MKNFFLLLACLINFGIVNSVQSDLNVLFRDGNYQLVYEMLLNTSVSKRPYISTKDGCDILDDEGNIAEEGVIHTLLSFATIDVLFELLNSFKVTEHDKAKKILYLCKILHTLLTASTEVVMQDPNLKDVLEEKRLLYEWMFNVEVHGRTAMDQLIDQKEILKNLFETKFAKYIGQEDLGAGSGPSIKMQITEELRKILKEIEAREAGFLAQGIGTLVDVASVVVGSLQRGVNKIVGQDQIELPQYFSAQKNPYRAYYRNIFSLPEKEVGNKIGRRALYDGVQEAILRIKAKEASSNLSDSGIDI